MIQAGAIGSAGEVLVLDMARPVRILDVAQRLVSQSGKDIEIIFTGLRHGEKLDEVLFSAGEHGVRRCHPLITNVSVRALDPSDLDALPDRLELIYSAGALRARQGSSLRIFDDPNTDRGLVT